MRRNVVSANAVSENLSAVWTEAWVRLNERSAVIGIIGLGYVGLPLAAAAAKAGFTVVGVDIDAIRVERLQRAESDIPAVPHSLLSLLVAERKFRATTDFGALADVDAVLICVPTPITLQREPDLSHVVDATKAVASTLRPGQLIVLESTTWPGTTMEVMKPILEADGLVSGEHFYLAFSPEREDPGNAHFSTTSIPKVVGADGQDALKFSSHLYGCIVQDVVEVSSTQTAEAVKLTENIFRSVNIALVNELKTLFHEMDINIWEVIEAAKSKPFGYMPFYPGPGLGGHCIPIDPFYLTWKAREYDLTTRFIELAGQINTSMPRYVTQRLAEELDARSGKGLNGSKILIVGVAYKKNVGDLRESPALKMIELLEERGAIVSYTDPHVPIIRESVHPRHGSYRSVSDLEGHDAAVIITDHDGFEYQSVLEACPFVLDTRNAIASRGLLSSNVAMA